MILKHYKYYFLLFFLISTNQLFSQDVSIKGKVLNNKNIVTGAFIELITDNNSKISISNDLGLFEFKNIKSSNDTLTFKISKTGFLTSIQKITLKSITSIIEFNILKDSIQILDEVVVTGSNTINKSNSTIYKLNSKDYIKNAKTDVALVSLPNLSITNEGIMVDNRKKAAIFIDGIESGLEDLKRLNAKDVDKIEVITNPSASFNSELLGAVIQVITKKTNETYLKGEVESFVGIRLGAYGLIPSLSFKTKSIISNTFYSFLTNNQIINNQLNRIENNNNFNQNISREVDGWQDYLSSRMSIKITSNSNLNFSGNLYRYNFKGSSIGRFTNNGGISNFNIDDKEKLNKWSLSSIYNHKIGKSNLLLIKFKYFDYINDNNTTYVESSGNELFNDIFSDTKEFSGEIVLEKKKLSLFKLPFEFTTGYRSIFRKFNFQSNNFNINQKINLFYLNTNIEFNSKFSLFSSLELDFTNNSSINLKQDYINLMPSLSLQYAYNEETSIRFDYSKKITRPSANYLNPNPIFFNPGFQLKGNINLLPQLRDLYELSFNKQLSKKSSFSLKFFNEYTDNAIVETFINSNNTITNSYENAGEVNIYGSNIGFNIKLFNAILVNLNSGVNYNKYISNSTGSLIKGNKGYSLNSNIYLNTLIKQKYSFSLSGNIVSPSYTLISKNEYQPIFTFEAESAFFKDKLNARLSYIDLFGLRSNSTSYINSASFSQNLRQNNKITNLTFTLIYNFGKTFSDRFSNPVINNNDIIVK